MPHYFSVTYKAVDSKEMSVEVIDWQLHKSSFVV